MARLTPAQLAANGAAIASFGTRIHNVLRVGELTTNLVAMYDSGQWRAYRHNAGPVYWRAAEFDYFLIAEGVPYEDVSRVVAWSRAGATLAPGMVSDDAHTRRPFKDAAAAWPGDTGESLEARARRLGWLATPRAEKPASPISSYARVVAQAAFPLGMRAQRYRGRTAMKELSAARRRELDALVERLTAGLTPVERRYVRTRLAGSRRGRPRQTQVKPRTLRWRRQQAAKNDSILPPTNGTGS